MLGRRRKIANLIIVEGARTTGKSTVTRRLRQNIDGSTLINFTGFKDDREEGLKKVTDYYISWMNFLRTLDNRYTVICDRMFFSEMVYSKLYKNYDFSDQFRMLITELENQNHNINLFLLTVEQVEIPSRLNREKVSLFNQIDDDVSNIIKQQDGYLNLYEEVKKTEFLNMNSYIINTTEKTIDEVYEEVLGKI